MTKTRAIRGRPRKSDTGERVIYLRVPADLAERVDNTRRRVAESSIVAFGIRALTNECERLEKDHNHGKRFGPPID
jgi:hypothetical protein